MNLYTDKINLSFPPEAVEKALRHVKENYRTHKDMPYADFPFVATYKVSHLKRYGRRAFPFQARKNEALAIQSRPANITAVPNRVLEAAQQSKREFVHVVLLKRLYYNDKQEVRIRFNTSYDTSIGYFSNDPKVTKRAISFLYGQLSVKGAILLRLHEFAIRLPRIAHELLNLPIPPQEKTAA